ncbi:MAG TPA: pyrrolo-quinoline quinone [Burkholderiales bacterium]|nr:pyrrolo-quinoline quinone [Burkholderiales bacterium]
MKANVAPGMKQGHLWRLCLSAMLVLVSCQKSSPEPTPTSSNISVTVTPSRGGLTLSQVVTLSATVANDVGGAGVTWSTTGGILTGTSNALTTFSSSAAGAFTITATSVADGSQSASATVGVTDLAGVFTQRYDAQRTGQNRQEFALTPATVSGSTFGKLFSCGVDAEVYAQPLYVANFAIAGGTHNIVLVATQNDSVYAFDADAKPCVQYWKRSFLGTGITTVPPADVIETGDINTKIGVLGTPVIDPATGTLYVVAKTKETIGTGCSVGSPCYLQRLHALDIATGAETFNGPADISSAITVTGSGDASDPQCPGSTAGHVQFCALRENQRPGLLLLNGKVYIAWASHGDNDPYHGWVIGYSAADLAQPPVLFNTTPDGSRGGIWMTGTGPAADAAGNIYVITGNGTFDTGTPRTNYGDSFLRLGTATGLSVADFFTPANQSFLDSNDFDVGSGGAIVVDSTGTHPHLLIGGDKQGVLYVVDRDSMSGFHPGGDQILQTVPITSGPACIICGIFSTPAFWEGNLYVIAIGDVLKQYTLVNSSLSLLPARQAGDMFGIPGASPAVSSNGTTNGIVWALDATNNGTNSSATSAPAILYAYDAISLTKLFSSPASGTKAAGNAVKFVVPTVANGKVYVGTQTELSVFGLLP